MIHDRLGFIGDLFVHTEKVYVANRAAELGAVELRYAAAMFLPDFDGMRLYKQQTVDLIAKFPW